MREVSVLFINLNPKITLDSIQTRNLLQNSFEVIQAALGHRHGTIIFVCACNLEPFFTLFLLQEQ